VISSDTIKALILKAWDDASLQRFNGWAADVSRVLTGRLRFDTNLYTQVVKPEVVSGTTKFPLTVTTRFAARPLGACVVGCVDVTNPNHPAAAGFPVIAWGWTSGLSIESVSGLTAGHRYVISILVIGG